MSEDRPTPKRRTRRRQFGTVRKLPSGRYQATYSHEGTRYAGDATFPTIADASAWLATIETDLRRGAWIAPEAGRVTVTELSKQWLASNPSKRSGTVARDETILRLHIQPTLGKAKIIDVSKVRVQGLVNSWRGTEARPRSPRTVRRQYDVLRAIFSYAVENDLLARTPCRGINLPAIGQETHNALSGDDVAAIADAISQEYRPMVYLGAVLGLRWGEVAGLKVEALDLDAGMVHISSQLGRDKKLGPPKSDAGRRSIAMPKSLVDLLKAHLEVQGITKPTALVFEALGGGPIDYTNWRRRTWLPAVEKAKLTKVGFHDLRRAAATALVRLGVDIKTAQTRLGHSDVRLTIGLYAQAETEADRSAADQLGKRFFGEIAHAKRTPTKRRRKSNPRNRTSPGTKQPRKVS